MSFPFSNPSATAKTYVIYLYNTNIYSSVYLQNNIITLYVFVLSIYSLFIYLLSYTFFTHENIPPVKNIISTIF